jgi:hypothetical protein
MTIIQIVFVRVRYTIIVQVILIVVCVGGRESIVDQGMERIEMEFAKFLVGVGHFAFIYNSLDSIDHK